MKVNVAVGTMNAATSQIPYPLCATYDTTISHNLDFFFADCM
jgi:hypothetical protein